MVAPRFQPEDIVWPLDERMVEAIQKNFEYLFRDLVEVDSKVILVSGGGTGLGAAGVGDLLVGTGTDVFALLADIALGNVLLSGGVGAAPFYGKVGLTTHVTGTLPIANGGTGQVTKTAAFDALSPLTTKGDLITHDGTNNIRVPVGAEGFTLVSRAAETSGLAWEEGGGTHDLLDADTHLDTETAAPVLGDLIAATAPAISSGAWFDGYLWDGVPSGDDIGSGLYWFDGLPLDALFGGSGDVKWRRLPAPSPGSHKVLASIGSDPFWSDPGTVAEVIATSQPKVRVYASASVSIADGAGTDDANGGTKIAFDTESFDTDGFHSTSVNTSRLTVPVGKAGFYLIVGQASWATSAGGRKACWPYKNGTLRLGVDEVPDAGDNGLGISHTAVTFAQLAEGDYVELHVRQDSGGALFSLGSATGDLTSLSMYKLP